MAHEIYTLSDGRQSMAYVGDTPWHGLGQKLTEGAPIETWAIEAGLNWQILQSPVTYSYELGGNYEFADFGGQYVNYRSDNGMPLSVVSSRYNIFQPTETLEFLREFVDAGGMHLHTAGTVKNGTKMWALAKINADFNASSNGKSDIVEPYLLIASSCDKSLATTAQLTSVRVVCNNTLQMAVDGKSSAVKVPHSTRFDADSVKSEMGLVYDSIAQSARTIQQIARLTVTDQQAMTFFLELLKTPEERKSGEVNLDSKRRAIPKLWDSYKSAPGSQDTVWGLVNAVTHSVDYNRHARSDDTRLNSAWFGQGATQKEQAFALATDTAFLDSLLGNSNTADGYVLDGLLRVA